MNNVSRLKQLLRRIGIASDGLYRVDVGEYTVLWRTAPFTEGAEELAVGLTEELCTRCHGEGDVPGCWSYLGCNVCLGAGFVPAKKTG